MAVFTRERLLKGNFFSLLGDWLECGGFRLAVLANSSVATIGFSELFLFNPNVSKIRYALEVTLYGLEILL